MRPPSLTPSTIHTLLCDADGTLFASEEPAFDASVNVTNRCMERWGVDRRFTATELRLGSSGKNFRATITDLALQFGLVVDDSFRAALDGWVAEENEAVIAHLADVLAPDPQVSSSLRRLDQRFQLAVVSSSAQHRVDVCLERTGISDLFAAQRRFSAQDSLPVPTSKPDPAIYQLACERLAVGPAQAVAIEDAAAGAESAVRAGLPTIGMLCFVPPAERAQRIADLHDVGVVDVVTSWPELERLLAPQPPGTQESASPTVEVRP